jgi:hypothetical protein
MDNLTNPDDLYEMLLENFERHADSRTPFHMTMNREFLTALPESGTVNTLQRFLQKVASSLLKRLEDFRFWNETMFML